MAYKFRIEKEGEPYFTSDTHFGHKNILKYSPNTRTPVTTSPTYSSMKQMNQALIQAWNSTVPNDDTIVYHLGDFAFGNPEDAENILDQLKGRIRLIQGNHDVGKFMEILIKHPKVVSIHDYLELKVIEPKPDPKAKQEEYNVVLFHYPIARWNRGHHGAIQLHGHTHGHYQHEGSGRIFDVGIDNRKDRLMKPYSWSEIKDKVLKMNYMDGHHRKD